MIVSPNFDELASEANPEERYIGHATSTDHRDNDNGQPFLERFKKLNSLTGARNTSLPRESSAHQPKEVRHAKAGDATAKFDRSVAAWQHGIKPYKPTR